MTFPAKPAHAGNWDGWGAAVHTAASNATATEVYVGAPTGNDTAAVNAAIAAAKAAGGPCRIVLQPGLYVCSSALTTLNATTDIALVGVGGKALYGGSALPSGAGATASTEIRYTGAGSGTFLSAEGADGFSAHDLAITYSNSSFTGTLVHVGAQNVTGPSYAPLFRDCYLGSTADSIRSATVLNLYQVVECTIENSVISGGNVGIDGSGPYANSITMAGGRFQSCNTAVLNPQFQWTFTGVVFEPGCSVRSSGRAAEGLTFTGCGWWDNTVNPWAWIDLQGGGLGIFGGYWEPQGAAGETLVKLNGVFDGAAIVGLRAHGQNGSSGSPVLALAAGGSVNNLHTAGLSLTNVVDGLAGARAVGAVAFSPGRATSEVASLGTVSSTAAVPFARSVALTLSANCTLTLPSVPAGGRHTIRLYVSQDGTGGRTATWPGSVSWGTPGAPTLTATASTTTVVEVETIDGGNAWFGKLISAGHAIGGGGGGTPATPVVEFDARDLGLADGATVTSWTDSSGNGRNAVQSGTSPRPTFATAGINGHPAVVFDGTRVLATGSLSTASLFPDGTFTLFAVARSDATSSYDAVAGMDPNEFDGRVWQLRYNVGSGIIEGLVFNNGAVDPFFATQTVTTGAHVFSIVRAAATVRAYVDGSAGSSVATTGGAQTTGSSAIALGTGGLQVDGSLAFPLNGAIGYLALYPGALDDAARAAREAELKAAWGTP
jgi:hypothetical protein